MKAKLVQKSVNFLQITEFAICLQDISLNFNKIRQDNFIDKKGDRKSHNQRCSSLSEELENY